jgi:hypothetical protein
LVAETMLGVVFESQMMVKAVARVEGAQIPQSSPPPTVMTIPVSEPDATRAKGKKYKI